MILLLWRGERDGDLQVQILVFNSRVVVEESNKKNKIPPSSSVGSLL